MATSIIKNNKDSVGRNLNGTTPSRFFTADIDHNSSVSFNIPTYQKAVMFIGANSATSDLGLYLLSAASEISKVAVKEVTDSAVSITTSGNTLTITNNNNLTSLKVGFWTLNGQISLV